MRTVPPALDVADDGLTALGDVDVLHRDLLLAFAAVAIERMYDQSRIGAGELVRRLGKFAELRGLWPVVGSHAMARTHMISKQHTSPIALAKSTAIGRKAMTYRNGFMRIGTAASQALSTSTISPITSPYGKASLRLRLLHHRRSLRLPLRNEPHPFELPSCRRTPTPPHCVHHTTGR